MANFNFKNVRIVDVLVAPTEQPVVKPYNAAKEKPPAPVADEAAITDETATEECAEAVDESVEETVEESASIEREPRPENQAKPNKDDCMDEAVSDLLKSLIRAAITKPSNTPAVAAAPRFQDKAEAC